MHYLGHDYIIGCALIRNVSIGGVGGALFNPSHREVLELTRGGVVGGVKDENRNDQTPRSRKDDSAYLLNK